MSDPDDLLALQQAALSVQDMRDALGKGSADKRDRISTTEAREEGFYWVVLGQNPPEMAYWERGQWWLAVDPKPWHPEAVTAVSERLVVQDTPGVCGMSNRPALAHVIETPASSGPKSATMRRVQPSSTPST